MVMKATGAKKIFAASIMLAALLSTASASADVPPISVGVRVGNVLIRDRGLDPVSAFDVNMQVSLYSEIDLFSLTQNDRVSAGLEWSTTPYNAPLFSVFQTETESHHALATLGYAYSVLPWLSPYVRTAAGVAFYDLTIDYEGYTAEDYWAFSGYSAVGAEFIVPYEFWGPDADATAGLKLEFGYTYRADPHFIATRPTDTPEDAAEIPVVGADLGHMPTNGFLITLDFFARF